MPGVLGVVGRIDWLELAPNGRPVRSGCAHNLYLSQGQSAAMGWLAGNRPAGLSPIWLHFGTGTAQPAVSDTALQHFVTAKSATGSAIEGNFTARKSLVLGGNQMTGLIREMLLAADAVHPTTAFARATLSARHDSGNSLVVSWRVVVLA
ncbi:MAG: hypothetical protein ACRDUA_11040 [Micromonosporaceae bacterium]